MKKLSFVLSLLLLSINLGTLQAEDSTKPCEKNIQSLLKEGFSGFGRYYTASQFTVEREANPVSLNGTKILAFMTTLTLKKNNDSSPAHHVAYNFYFNPETCEFFNGVARPQVKEDSENMHSIPKDCEKSKIMEKINHLVKEQELEGKIVSDLLFPVEADRSGAMNDNSSFAIFNSLKIDGKPHVLVTYFNEKTCEEVQHYFSEQLPYSE
jgi:hypothetical protein